MEKNKYSNKVGGLHNSMVMGHQNCLCLSMEWQTLTTVLLINIMHFTANWVYSLYKLLYHKEIQENINV